LSLRDDLQALCDTYVAAYRQGDAAGCAAVFTADGVMFSAFAAPARGRAAIAAQHADWTAGGEGKTLTVVDCAGSGDVAWFLATFAEGHETGEGISLNACSREPGGPWRISVCSLTAA
jgi:uncharacterized protein (TIGR02246 family)